jgi:disulfide bond formation protein DsbB
MRRTATFRTIAGIVLAWYALFLGASIASAGINGMPFQMVCSADGNIQWVATGDEQQPSVAHGTMDCPLCAGSFLAPPPERRRSFASPLGASAAPLAIAHAPVVRSTAPPPPSRGPPASLNA